MGAQRHTQCLDVAHGAPLVIEKGLDSHSGGSFAQADWQRLVTNLGDPAMGGLAWCRPCSCGSCRKASTLEYRIGILWAMLQPGWK